MLCNAEMWEVCRVVAVRGVPFDKDEMGGRPPALGNPHGERAAVVSNGKWKHDVRCAVEIR